jgi:hypothetical protein
VKTNHAIGDFSPTRKALCQTSWRKKGKSYSVWLSNPQKNLFEIAAFINPEVTGEINAHANYVKYHTSFPKAVSDYMRRIFVLSKGRVRPSIV